MSELSWPSGILPPAFALGKPSQIRMCDLFPLRAGWVSLAQSEELMVAR
jgi:hypothetical protein